MYNLYMKLIILGLIILVISVIIYFSNKSCREGAVGDKKYIKISKSGDWTVNSLKFKCGESEISVDKSAAISDLSDANNTVIELPFGIDERTCPTTVDKTNWTSVAVDDQGVEQCKIHGAGESNKWYCSGWNGANKTGKFEKLGSFDATSADDCINKCKTDYGTRNNHECQKGDYLPEIEELDSICSSDETKGLVFAGLTINQWLLASSKGVEDYIKWINKGGGEPIENMNVTVKNLPQVANKTTFNLEGVRKYVEEIKGGSKTVPIQFGDVNRNPSNDYSLVNHRCWEHNYFGNSFNALKRRHINEWAPPSADDPRWHKELCDKKIGENNYEVYATGHTSKDPNPWGKFKACCQFTYYGDGGTSDANRGPYQREQTQTSAAKNLKDKCEDANTCMKSKLDNGETVDEAVTNCEAVAENWGGFEKAAYSVGIKLAEGPEGGKNRKQRLCEAKVAAAKASKPYQLGRDQNLSSQQLYNYGSWGDLRDCCQFGIGGDDGYGPYKNDDGDKLVDACKKGEENRSIIDSSKPLPPAEEMGAWRVGKKLGTPLEDIRTTMVNDWIDRLDLARGETEINTIDTLKDEMDNPLRNWGRSTTDENNFIKSDPWVVNFLNTFDTRRKEYEKRNMFCSDWSGTKKYFNSNWKNCGLGEGECNYTIETANYGTGTGDGVNDGDGNFIGAFRVHGSLDSRKIKCKAQCASQNNISEADTNEKLQCSEGTWKTSATSAYAQHVSDLAETAAEEAQKVADQTAADAAAAQAASDAARFNAAANGQTCVGPLWNGNDGEPEQKNGKYYCVTGDETYPNNQRRCYFDKHSNGNTYYGTTKQWGNQSDCIAAYGTSYSSAYGTSEAICTQCPD